MSEPLLVPTTLAGARCTLRGFTAGDAASIALHGNDNAVARNMTDTFPSPMTLAAATEWVTRGWREFGGIVWCIDVGGEAVGSCGVHPAEGQFRCNVEIGYWLGQAFWRRGIATESVRLMVAWTWANLAVATRIHAPVFSWNDASRGVLRKNGFVLEGVMKQSRIKDGKVIDQTSMALYRDNKLHE
jgi:[ribosomal protein S5]-alanine N-acetyltransferase